LLTNRSLPVRILLVHEGARVLSALAAAALVLVSSSYLVAGRLLHFATLGASEDPARAAMTFGAAALAALVHERLVRGALYTSLRARLTPGLGAPAVAFLGALLPTLARLTLLPRASAPFSVRLAHALLVETLLGFGLAWLALGSGTWIFSGAALALVWGVRLFVVPVFHGGVLPLLEALAALLAALAVAGVLARELAPHRETVLGA
jgi:hypothetical protein